MFSHTHFLELLDVFIRSKGSINSWYVFKVTGGKRLHLCLKSIFTLLGCDIYFPNTHYFAWKASATRFIFSLGQLNTNSYSFFFFFQISTSRKKKMENNSSVNYVFIIKRTIKYSRLKIMRWLQKVIWILFQINFFPAFYRLTIYQCTGIH